MITEARLREIGKQLGHLTLTNNFHLVAVELFAEVHRLTKCKYFYLNPLYPVQEPNTYKPCDRMREHTGPCGEPHLI